jgi:hypothetical protein
MFGSLKKHSHPEETGDHPELDKSKVMDNDGHRKKYQMLIGILVWLVVIGRINVAHATLSLSWFTACPRKGHLDQVLHQRSVASKWGIDSRPILGMGPRIDSTHGINSNFAWNWNRPNS